MSTLSSKIMNELISEQEQQCLGKILSIQDYYKLNDHRKLIRIILDHKECEKLFESEKIMISNMFETSNKEDNEKERVKLFAQKYTYENLVEKFPRPKAGTNDVLLNILKQKMKKEVINSHQTLQKINSYLINGKD